MSARFIALQPYFQAAASGSNNGYRFRVVVTDVGGLDDRKIFRYLQRPWRMDDTESVLTFDGVCSPADLAEYRPDTPDPSRLPAFCRLDYVDLLSRSRSEADETWTILQAEVTGLLSALSDADSLAAADLIILGDVSESSSSESE